MYWQVPTGLGWCLEPHLDINYNIIVMQQAALCALGLLLWVWHALAPEDCGEQTICVPQEKLEGFWVVMCPFPFMLAWAGFVR
jgi:hypothetical protein